MKYTKKWEKIPSISSIIWIRPFEKYNLYTTLLGILVVYAFFKGLHVCTIIINNWNNGIGLRTFVSNFEYEKYSDPILEFGISILNMSKSILEHTVSIYSTFSVLINDHLIILLFLMPLIGLFAIFLLPKRFCGFIGFLSSFISFLISLQLLNVFDSTYAGFQFITKISVIIGPVSSFYIGLDGVSIFFISLTTFIITLCLCVHMTTSNNTGVQLDKLYVLSLLLIEVFILLSFIVTDLLLFFIFFEGGLIPIFLIIGTQGSNTRRIVANFYLFLYTLFGSIFLLSAILLLNYTIGSLNYYILVNTLFTDLTSKYIWLFLFISFAIKIPMFPFHIWLPEAHVEAPTIGSIILASLLLKLGGYGFIRFLIPILPEATIYFQPLVITLGMLGFVYGSFTAVRQVDLKKIIAYSSIAHMNLGVVGLFSLNYVGLLGFLILMLSHGLVSTALFYGVGYLYERFHSRLLFYYGGLVQKMPTLATFFLFFVCANAAFPGTGNFTGEVMLLLGIYLNNFIIGAIAVSGVILSATYSMWFYNRVFFGDLKTTFFFNSNIKKRTLNAIDLKRDLQNPEVSIFMSLVFLSSVIGLYPTPIIHIVEVSIKNVLI